MRSRFRSPAHLDGLVLTALVGPGADGYAITGQVRDQVERAEGTVYPVLHRLERCGLVRSRWADVAGRRRRVYELTGAGAAAVTELRPSAAGPFRVGHSVRWSA